MSEEVFLDLASNVTGWAYARDAEPIQWGHFRVNKQGLKVEDGAAYVNQVCSQVYHHTLSLIERFGIGVVVYEFTDWHRDVVGGRKSAKQRRREYAIERRTQYALGQMAATMANFSYLHNLHVYSVGANVVKGFVGSNDKREVARWVAGNWPDLFTFTPDVKKNYYITDHTGKLLINDVSDALSITGYWQAKLRGLVE